MMNVNVEPALAFSVPPHESPALEIRVNFGVFSGREATAAEIDELAKELLPEIGEVTIVAEQRHELSPEVEASLHQVRVEVEPAHVPAGASEREALSDRLVAACDRWARACIADRHLEF